MSKNIRLNEYEKGKIPQLKSLIWSQRKIALKIGRSKTTIEQYLSSKSINTKRKEDREKKIYWDKNGKKNNKACKQQENKLQEIKSIG
jgi:IS30 family transposase